MHEEVIKHLKDCVADAQTRIREDVDERIADLKASIEKIESRRAYQVNKIALLEKAIAALEAASGT